MAVIRSSGVLFERIGAGLTFSHAYFPRCAGAFLHSTKRSETDKKSLARVTLFSKPTGCSLCVVAKKALLPFSNRIELIEIDITLPESRQWFDKYQYEIPVIHFNGQFLMKHLVDTKLLESTLVNWEKDQKLSKWFSYKLIGSVFKAVLRMQVIWLRTSLINRFCRRMHCTLYIHLFVLHYFHKFVTH